MNRCPHCQCLVELVTTSPNVAVRCDSRPRYLWVHENGQDEGVEVRTLQTVTGTLIPLAIESQELDAAKTAGRRVVMIHRRHACRPVPAAITTAATVTPPKTSTTARTSDNAGALLAYLRARANRREDAKTDKVIARALRCHVREVIDLADDLIRAGHLVIAETRKPCGRWILEHVTADVAAAQRYDAALKQRAARIFARRRNVRRLVATAIAAAAVEPNGQTRIQYEEAAR